MVQVRPAPTTPAAVEATGAVTPSARPTTTAPRPSPSRTTSSPRPTRTSSKPTPPPEPKTDPRFRNCKEANKAGYGPYYRGVDPEYAWYRDQDGDGVVCER
ncbi:excalibur calcium-binding domain-containing protein [Micromonospora sp. MP36]|nr:excalibur calcium-binding domain-containing protein [Micromonospora sp. MP36]